MTGRIAPARRALTTAHFAVPEGEATICGLPLDPAELWQTVPPDAMVPTCKGCQGEEEELSILDAITWLEEQATDYKTQLDDPAAARTLPTAPDHLTYPGAEQLPPKASTIAQDLRA
ncbi:hypothetical protein [Streptosporangium saharense]|uniref:hypothetical protein n=1 Tax=Streptosporangium saharense TaxID=1706840 RepID=UPI003326DAE3